MVARSFTLRAVIALLLLAFFYVSALTIGFGLIAFALWSLTLSKTIHVQGFLVFLAAGASVLLGLVPTFSKWVAPGIRVDERSQPRLFAVIGQIAKEMGQAMPAEVYLVSEPNAFVMQVGGALGVGGRRVMGLGLPLLEVMNVSQLRAIIAHEFGHFAGGDVRLGALTRVTRGAMIRTLENADRTRAGFLARPLSWIFTLYLRVTQAISRQQELLADEWAVRIAGKTAFASGLRQSHLSGETWSRFMSWEVEPLGDRGFIPKNLFEGFRSFATSTHGTAAREQSAQNLTWARPHPYDSHPPTSERIAWAHTQSHEAGMDTTPARALIDGRAALETQLSARQDELEQMDWGELGRHRAQGLDRRAARVQVRVEGMTVQQALDLLTKPERRAEFAERVDPHLIKWTMPDRQQLLEDSLRSALGAYLGVLLAARGLEWRSSPGEALWLQKGETLFKLHDAVGEILQGKRSADVVATLLDSEGVGRSETVQVEKTLGWELERPRCEITLEPRSSYVIVTGELRTLILPRCCAICMKPAVTVETPEFEIMKELIVLEVPTCAEHEGKAKKAVSVRSWRPVIGQIGLEVKNAEYAGLIETVNG